MFGAIASWIGVVVTAIISIRHHRVNIKTHDNARKADLIKVLEKTIYSTRGHINLLDSLEQSDGIVISQLVHIRKAWIDSTSIEYVRSVFGDKLSTTIEEFLGNVKDLMAIKINTLTNAEYREKVKPLISSFGNLNRLVESIKIEDKL